jgi:hypothetical protein
VASLIAVENYIRKDDGINEVVVKEAQGQRLNVDYTIKPNKMEVGALREDNLPAENSLMVKGTNIVFTACCPQVVMDVVKLLLGVLCHVTCPSCCNLGVGVNKVGVFKY